MGEWMDAYLDAKDSESEYLGRGYSMDINDKTLRDHFKDMCNDPKTRPDITYLVKLGFTGERYGIGFVRLYAKKYPECVLCIDPKKLNMCVPPSYKSYAFPFTEQIRYEVTRLITGIDYYL